GVSDATHVNLVVTRTISIRASVNVVDTINDNRATLIPDLTYNLVIGSPLGQVNAVHQHQAGGEGASKRVNLLLKVGNVVHGEGHSGAIRCIGLGLRNNLQVPAALSIAADNDVGLDTVLNTHNGELVRVGKGRLGPNAHATIEVIGEALGRSTIECIG